jgi:uncharacterized protein YbdZ (MbtH family)
MDRLIEAIGPLPNAMITAVIVIDDRSTRSDQIMMLQRYPTFTFLFKPYSSRSADAAGANAGGHAHSMNIMFRLVNTQYLIYLEDDWLIRSNDAILIHPTWIELVRSLNHHHHHHHHRNQDNAQRSDSHDDDDDDDRLFESFYSIIVYAFSILGFEGRIDVPSRHGTGASKYTSINLTHSYRDDHSNSNYDHDDDDDHHHHHHHDHRNSWWPSIPIHQVLFNEQSNRDCAIGNSSNNSRCSSSNNDDSLSQLSLGGWIVHRSIRIDSWTEEIEEVFSFNASVPYSLHEFGLASSSLTSSFSNHRNHDFSFWPGFSFNPGIWDLSTIRRSLMDCMDIIESDVFDISDHGFEQQFSLLAYEVGLNMAYLPIVLFEEISKGQSAYRLNNITRPWEETKAAV